MTTIKADTLRAAVVSSSRPVFAQAHIDAYVCAETVRDNKAKADARAKSKAADAAAALLSCIPADTADGVVVGILNGCAELRVHMVGSAADRGLSVGRWFADSGLRAALLARGWKLGAASVKGAPYMSAESCLFRIPDPARAAGGAAKAANKAKADATAADADTDTDTGTDTAAPSAPSAPGPVVYTAEQCAAALSALSPAEAAALLVAAFAEAGEADALAEAVMVAAGWELAAETAEQSAPVRRTRKAA